jgi:hypothetical protein
LDGGKFLLLQEVRFSKQPTLADCNVASKAIRVLPTLVAVSFKNDSPKIKPATLRTIQRVQVKIIAPSMIFFKSDSHVF